MKPRRQAAAANCLPNASMVSRVATTLRTSTSGRPGRVADAGASAGSSFTGASPTAEKPLISREICPIRRGSTKISGIVGQGSTAEVSLVIDNKQPTFVSRQKRPFLCSSIGGSSSLRLRIWMRPPSISTQATRGTCSRGLPCCSGNGNVSHAASSAFRSATRSCPMSLCGPRNPLLGNVQLRQMFQVLFGLPETTALRPRVHHLLQHPRTRRVVRRNPQCLRLREKKPSDIACIVRRILARRLLLVWPGGAVRRFRPRGSAPRIRCTCPPHGRPLPLALAAPRRASRRPARRRPLRPVFNLGKRSFPKAVPQTAPTFPAAIRPSCP